MKLLTKEETKPFYKQFEKECLDGNVKLEVAYQNSVNALLMDAKIVKSLFKQAKRIKEKNS
jgi:hypothetical protein